jgi:hypothetical protein
MRNCTDTHLDHLSQSQQNRKLNSNNSTGEKGISKQGTGFKVEIGGTYIGRKKTLGEAIAIRDAARLRLFKYAKELE